MTRSIRCCQDYLPDIWGFDGHCCPLIFPWLDQQKDIKELLMRQAHTFLEYLFTSAHFKRDKKLMVFVIKV